MRKILSLVLAVVLMASVSVAQKGNQNDGTLKGIKSYAAPYSSTKAETAVLSYCNDVITTILGNANGFSTNAFVYFPAADFSANVGETIYKMSVGVGGATDLTSFSICIWTDTTGHGATPAYEQVVTGLVDGWNEIYLATPYVLGTDDIFIGYRMATSGYSLGCDDAADATGYGDMLQDPTSGAITHLGSIGTPPFGDLSLKAHVGSLSAIEGELVSVNTPAMLNAGMVDITGTVKNNGSAPITSYDVTYTLNGGAASAVYSVTGANILIGETADFTHDVPADMSTPDTYTVVATIANINGGTDSDLTNNSATKDVVTVANFVQKKALHEVLTSSTCGPCAAANPAIDAVVYENNEDKSTLIKYQVSWPLPGDPYNNQESQDRVDYYGTTGVPDFKVDGINTESGANYTQAKLDGYVVNSAKATIVGTATYVGSSVSVDIDFTATDALAGNLVAQIAVIEKRTVNNVGNNGETEFNNVMMKFIPTTSGNTLLDFADGDVQNVTGTVDMSTTFMEEATDLRVVAWIQDNTTLEVFQSEYIEVTSTAIDASVSAVTAPMSPAVCGGLTTTEDVTITIENAGFADISNFTVGYTVNGGTAVEETYTGTIAIGGSASYTFTAQADLSASSLHTVNAYAALTGDANASNDATEIVLSNGSIPVVINIVTDQYGTETTWSLIDEATGNTVLTGGPYNNTDQEAHTAQFCALPDQCFEFTINDAYGDGMCCTYGIGSYEVLFDGVSMVTGGEFADSETTTGLCTQPDGINNLNNNAFNIYPNPSTGLVNIVGVEGAQVIVYNMLGSVVYSNAKASASTTVDLSSFNAGNYIVKVINNEEVTTQKVVLTK